MGLDAKFELRIDGGLVMEVRVHPQTHPDAIADMLADVTGSFRNGFESMMTCGDSLTTDNADPANQDGASEPLPVEWKYHNYHPITETESTSVPCPDNCADANGCGDRDNEPKPDFYAEQPLIGEIPYSINGIPAVKINYHPAMGIDCIADILEDAAKDLRKELNDRNPLKYDPDAISLTVPAMHVGKHLTNLMDSYLSKFAVALEMEDYENSDKYFNQSEKLYEWMCRNYTPQAIKNSPELQEQSRRIESFRGIREANPTTTI